MTTDELGEAYARAVAEYVGWLRECTIDEEGEAKGARLYNAKEQLLQRVFDQEKENAAHKTSGK